MDKDNSERTGENGLLNMVTYLEGRTQIGTAGK
jgi:hypothetical protein